MEQDDGMIRDKQKIREVLQESQTMNCRLAVCYDSNGKLTVMIGTVLSMEEQGEELNVTLQAPAGDSELMLPLSRIQSIYPIRQFNVQRSLDDVPEEPSHS